MVTKKEKLYSPVGGTMNITGGWGPWITPKPTGHRAYDMLGVGKNTYLLWASLNGKIVKPTSIPIYAKSPWMDDYGFAIKADSGEWVLYNHCVSGKHLGQKVDRGKRVGEIDTLTRQRALRKKWGVPPGPRRDYGFTGRHLHFELITDRGDQNTDRVNPLYFMDRSFELAGQYDKRQYTMPNGNPMPDLYIVTKVTEDPCKKCKEDLVTCMQQKEHYRKTNTGLNKQVISLKKELESCQSQQPEDCTLINLIKKWLKR